MNNLVHNLLQHYLNNNQEFGMQQQQQQQQQNQHNNNGNLLGSGPMDWLTNAATFGGADLLLNKIDDEEHKQHFWRNAGIAGALALGYQYYRNHHHPNHNQMTYQYPYYNSNPQLQQQYYPSYPLQQQNPYYMMQPQYTGFPTYNNMMQPYMLNNYQAMGPNPMTPFFPQYQQQQMIPYGAYPHYNRMF